jgi:hypothetical protein
MSNWRREPQKPRHVRILSDLLDPLVIRTETVDFLSKEFGLGVSGWSGEFG